MKSKSKSKGKVSGKAQQHNASGRNQSITFEAVSKNGGRNAPNSGYGIVWADDAFPALGASAAVPEHNVWEERKAKMESVIALQPQNEYDEQAMLQQALAMSLLEEEERKKREEEELMLQMEAANYENAVSELEHIDTTSVSSVSKTEYSKGSISRNAASNFNQKDKPVTSGGVKPKINKIIDSFGGWGLKDSKNNSGKLSEFVNDVVEETSKRQPDKYRAASSSENSQAEKKVIGGGRNSKAVSRENSWRSEVTKHVDSGTWEDEEVLHSTLSSNEISYSKKKAIGSGRNTGAESRENTWSSEVKKHSADLDSWEDEKVLYNGKGTFTDLDDVQLDDLSIKSKSSELPKNVSPNKALDTWLNADDWENDTLKEEKKSLSNDCVNSEEINFVDSTTSIPLNTYLSSNTKFIGDQDSNTEKERTDIFNVLKPGKSEINSWENHKETITSRESIISQNNVKNHNIDTTYSFETAQTSLNSNDIWANPSSTTSPYLSFPGTLEDVKQDEIPIKFNNEAQNEFLNDELNEHAEIPPILPPKPVPVPVTEETANVENKTFVSETSNAHSKDELPNILQPHALPGFQPQPFVMNNPLLNPACMIPGLDPLYSCGLDPIAMRQMLMLSNPFFASQLCAMEQYYRSMGMPVDLFSFPSMPNVVPPAMLNMGLGPFPNTANAFMQNVPSGPQFQNTLGNNLIRSESQDDNASSKQNSFDRSAHLSESGVAASSTNDKSVLQNENDSWYQSYLSSDCSEAIPPPKPTGYNSSEVIPPPVPTVYGSSDVIPPPKASTYSNSENNVLSVPKMSQCNQKDLAVNNHTSLNYTSDYLASYTPETNVDNNQKKTLSAVEACMTKTVVTGWDDSDEEVVGVSKPKTTSKWDDDGWGDPVPTKPLKNTYDDKRVCRQPVRQPQVSRQPVRPSQLSHFQKNKH